MKKIKIGGVHEYSNVVFIQAMMNDIFHENGLDVEWRIYDSGSAPLARALKDGEIDFAIILTDSAIKSIADGVPITLISPYVLSPLEWVFHTPFNSKVGNLTEIADKRFAISRPGSGGQLITLLWAKQNGLKIKPEQFIEVGNLVGAVRALAEGIADVFPWERLTTLHLVENKTFKAVGSIETPFSPFSIACSKKFAEENEQTVNRLLTATYISAIEMMQRPDAPRIISAIYHTDLAEAEKSFEKIEWATNADFKEGMIGEIVDLLIQSGAIKNPLKEDDIVTPIKYEFEYPSASPI